MSPILQKAIDRQRQALNELNTAIVGAQNGLNYLRNAKRKLDWIVRAETITDMQCVFATAIREGRWPADCEVVLSQRLAVYPNESDVSCLEVDGHYVAGLSSLASHTREFTAEMARILVVMLQTAEELTPYVESVDSTKLTP